MNESKYRVTVSEDSLTVTFAKKISLKQAWKPLLPGVALISGVEIILLVVSLIWLDLAATIGLFIMACISVFAFLYVAILEVKESKNFCFTVDKNGVTVFTNGKRSFVAWKDVAVAGSCNLGGREGVYRFIIFFTSKKYDVTNVTDRAKITEKLRPFSQKNTDDWMRITLYYHVHEEREEGMTQEIYASLCEYMDRYIPNVKRCDVDEVNCYKSVWSSK